MRLGGLDGKVAQRLSSSWATQSLKKKNSFIYMCGFFFNVCKSVCIYICLKKITNFF